MDGIGVCDWGCGIEEGGEGGAEEGVNNGSGSPVAMDHGYK